MSKVFISSPRVRPPSAEETKRSGRCIGGRWRTTSRMVEPQLVAISRIGVEARSCAI